MNGLAEARRGVSAEPTGGDKRALLALSELDRPLLRVELHKSDVPPFDVPSVPFPIRGFVNQIVLAAMLRTGLGFIVWGAWRAF